MLAVQNRHGSIAIDCGSDLVQKLLAAKLELDRLEGLVITHEHPDHVGGFPLLMQRLWLLGRRRPIIVAAPAPALAVAQKLWDLFHLSEKAGMPAVEWHLLEVDAQRPGLPFETWNGTYGPVSHGPVTIAVRFSDPDTGGTVTYSSDTAPDPRVAELAAATDILVHEATGSGDGHSSAVEAADVGRQAGAGRLLLVHLPAPGAISETMLEEARRRFPRTTIGQEGGSYLIRDGAGSDGGQTNRLSLKQKPPATRPS